MVIHLNSLLLGKQSSIKYKISFAKGVLGTESGYTRAMCCSLHLLLFLLLGNNLKMA